MSKIQYVADIETPYIKKLYDKEDNFKVETLTCFGIICELEKLQDKIEILEKALELACKTIYSLTLNDKNEDESIKDKIEYFKIKAKEMK